MARAIHLGSVLNSEVAGSSKIFGLFGEISTHTTITPASSPVTYGFTGHMVDLESGLNRTQYRQYDSKVGRWLSQDPIGSKSGDLNYYGYVKNIRLILTDPDGRFPVGYLVVGAAAIVAVGCILAIDYYYNQPGTDAINEGTESVIE